MDAGGWQVGRKIQFSPSKLMKEFIWGAEDYHCFGCLSNPDQTALKKLALFWISIDPNAKNPFKEKRNNIGGSGVVR